MKRIIMFVLLFAALKVAGQTTGYLRFDTVKIMKQNGTCELYVINKTKDSLGLLTNIGGGLTSFKRSRAINDSMLIVGLDTLTIKGAGASATQLTDSSFKVGNDTIVIRTLEWVSVLDFGAKANDTLTDYTTNIQAALNSGARTVLVPAGTYIITSTIEIGSNQTLLAYGAKFLRKSNAVVNVLINKSNGTIGGYAASTNVKILGLAVDGNAANYTTASCCIAFGHANTLTIRDCDFTNAATWHLMELNACQNVVVDNCNFHDANLTNREFLQIDFASNSAAWPAFGPYDSTACNNILIQNCIFKNGYDQGIGSHAAIADRPHKNIVIKNCTFRNLRTAAIAPVNYDGLLIEGNYIDSIGWSGIVNYFAYNNVLGLNRRVKIINNTIQHTQTGYGINFDYVKDLLISGNTIDSIAGQGIFLRFNDSVIINNNTVSNFGLTAIGPSGPRYGIAAIGTANTRIINNNIISTLSSNPIVARDSGSFISKNIFIEGNIIKRPNLLGDYYQLNQYTPLQCSNCFIGKNIVNDTILPNTVAITSDYTLAGTEGTVNVNTTSGPINVTMNPKVIPEGGVTFSRQGANTLTLLPSTGTINGQSSLTVDSIVTIKSDGINYYTTGNNKTPAGSNYYIQNQFNAAQVANSWTQGTSVVSSTGPYRQDIAATMHILQGGSNWNTLSLERAQSGNNPPELTFFHNENSDINVNTPASSGKWLGQVIWLGGDKTTGAITTYSSISSFVSIGSSFNGGGFSFRVKDTTDGVLRDRLFINTNGYVRIGGNAAVAYRFHVQSGDAYFANNTYHINNVGIGTTSPTARLHLPAGTATANTAPLKFVAGTNLTTPEDGAIEYNGTHYYATIGSTRYQLDQQSGPSYTFSNGLYESSGNVKLGGPLTEFTDIDNSGNEFFLHGTAGNTLRTVNGNFQANVTSSTTSAGLQTNNSSNNLFSEINAIEGGVDINAGRSGGYYNNVHLDSTGFKYTGKANTTPINFSIDPDGVMSNEAYAAGTTITGIPAYTAAFTSTGQIIPAPLSARTIATFYTDANNSGTTATDLYTKTVTANTLNNNGESLDFIVSGNFNDASATVKLEFDFDGQIAGNTGTLTLSATGSWEAKITLIRTSSSTARVTAKFDTPTGNVVNPTQQIDLSGLNFANPLDLVIYATAGGAGGGSNDITGKLGRVIWYPAP